MKHVFNRNIIVLLVISMVLVAGAAQAEVELRWSPADTTNLSLGETTRLSIHLDEPINIRTVEITVHYDTTVVSSLGGGSGSLYSESGYFVFDGFEEEPGSWHGFAIIMGAGEYVTGPGELLYWDIEGVAGGICPVITVEALLYDELSPPNLIPDVHLNDALVKVFDPDLSAVPNLPATGIPMRLAPNPFNPKTRISFDVEQDTQAQLSVFDLRGRRIADLFDGHLQAGSFSTDWNGVNDNGRSQPGGIYVFRLTAGGETSWAKGILAK